MTERGRGACRSVCSLLASWYPLPCGPAGAVPHPPPPLPTPGRKQMHPHGELRGVLAGPGSSRKSSQTPRFLFSTEKWGNPLYPGGRRLLGCMGRMAQLSTGHSPASALLLADHRAEQVPRQNSASVFPGKDLLGHGRHAGQLRLTGIHRNLPRFCCTGGRGGGWRHTPHVKSKANPGGLRGSELPAPPALKATRGTNYHLPSPPRGAREEPAAENSQARNSENPSEA